MIYLIENTHSGATLGFYAGANEAEALDALARDAGYANHAAACEVAQAEDGELAITALGEAENSEAVTAALNDEDAEMLPYRVLNEGGQAALSAWVAAHHKRASGQHLPAWFAEAEEAAAASDLGEGVNIEISAHDSVSGHTEWLSLPPEYFTWEIEQ